MPESEEGAGIGKTFEDALALNPKDVKLASTCARIVREEKQLLGEEERAASDAERQRMADEIIDRMVAADPENPEALLARFLYRTEYDLPEAEQDLADALKYGPDNEGVVLVAAAHAQAQARQAEQESDSAIAAEHYVEAQAHYEHAIKLAPTDERAYAALGEVYIAQDETALAIATWRRGLEGAGDESLRLNAYLAEALISEKKLDEAKQPLDTLDRVLRRLRPNLPPAVAATQERSAALLRAKWLMARGDAQGYLQAIPLLRPVALGQKSTAAEVATAVQAWSLLGGACEMVAQWDRAALAYEEAADLRPDVQEFRVKAADAWSSAGRIDKAIMQYAEALRIGDSKAIRISLARARFQRELTLPKAERDWQPFRTALAEAKESHDEISPAMQWSLVLLEVDSIFISAEERGAREEGAAMAAELLRQVEEEHSDSPGFLERLVTAYDQLGCPADAARALERFESLDSDSAATYLLRASRLTSQQKYEEAREVLRAGIATLPAAAHGRLQYELSQISLREGKTAQARAELTQLHEDGPPTLAVIRQLSELSLESGDFEDARRWEDELRKLEGPGGVESRYAEARRLLMQSKGVEDAVFVRAAELQVRIQKERPEWPAAYLLGGLILQRQGKLDQAIEAFRQAIRLGERRVATYEALILLLNQVGRVAEADQYLTSMQEYVAASERLSSLQMVVAAKLGQLDRAVEAARRQVEQRPEDAVARIQLGQLLLAEEKPVEAEKVLREAVTLAPTDVGGYNALFTCYLRMDQKDRAREVLEDIAQRADLPEGQRAYVLAQSYEQLGDSQQAEAAYREAKRLCAGRHCDRAGPGGLSCPQGRVWRSPRLSAAPTEIGPRLGRYPAEVSCRPCGSRWGSRMAGAQRLLESAGPEGSISSLDRRLQALLLMERGGQENLVRARQLLETLVADSSNSVDGDRLALARIYEREDNLQLARQQYTALVSRAEPKAAHLALYIDMLLRHNLSEEAGTWLDKLETGRPMALMPRV